MHPTPQLIDYVRQSLAQGTNPAAIHNQLTQTGWPVEMVDEAFDLAQAGAPIPPTPTPPPPAAPATSATGIPAATTPPGTLPPERAKRIRQGIWWIVSPFIILFIGLVIAFLFQRTGTASPIINIASALIGIIGVIMVPVGLIVGIIKIAKQ